MASPKSLSGEDLLRNRRDFSLVPGGPLYQLLRRAHLSGDALELMRRRAIWIPLFAWLPLLLLSPLEGQAPGGSVAVYPSCGTWTSMPASWWRCRSSSSRSWWFTSACASWWASSWTAR